MSTPIIVPTLQKDARPANPLPGGLYTAASLVELPAPARIDWGVDVRQINCGTARVWRLNCEDQDDTTANPDKGSDPADVEVPERRPFPAFGVLATSECSLVGTTEDEVNERAMQTMRLQEPITVEAEVVPELIDSAGTLLTAADGIVGAVARLELALGRANMAGVIHASPVQAAWAADKGLIVRGTGGKLYTPLGHQWAFGGGYEALGNTLVGTGPVTVYRSAIDPRASIDHRRNVRLSIAEREVSVTWECVTVGTTI